MGNTLSLTTLLLIALSPLAGALLVGIFGTKMGGNVLGRAASHTIAIAGVAISFVLSAQVLWQVTTQGAGYNGTVYEWANIGGLVMEVGFLVDGLTAMMMCVVTFVSLMVHIYTMGYMQEDAGYKRFFSYISLFTFAMLMLVMSNNLLQLFFGWEAVGLVSYLLIGFWYNKPTAIFANFKAFMVNRVGDFGFILGIGLIASTVGSLNYSDIFAFAREGKFAGLTLGSSFAGADWALITVICICLFIGAMGKSAQFPLHVWLPDSMEGPTPISALIHAATMVTAGIFMVARMSYLYELSDTALNLIMIIGSITALFMGILGIIQNDIKRVVAYSTLSQLGYMTVALGASAYSVAVFHLMTHAFFKALLFLAAGAVIVAMHHNQDIRYMGGLARYKNMRITWLTSLVGSLALIGAPLFSGFYSKDAIIEAVHASNLPAHGFANFAVLAGVFITAFYSFRMYFLVFHGKERWDQLPHDEHHGDDHHEEHHELPINPGWSINLPLVLLAIPSAFIGGWSLMQFVGESGFLGSAIFVDHSAHPAMQNLSEEIHGAWAMALHGLTTAPFWLALAGVVAAWYFYLKNPAIPTRLKAFFTSMGVYQLLDNKYYLDWINENIIARCTRALGTVFWKAGDEVLIDGTVVNGSWRVVGVISALSKHLQTGYLYHYALAMIAGLFALTTYALWPYLAQYLGL